MIVAALLGCSSPATPVELWLGGDVFLGDGVDRPLDGIAGKLRGVGIVNLEGPVGEPPGSVLGPLPLSGSSQARLAEPRVVLRNGAGALASLQGVGVAGIENNHAGDVANGREATVEALAAVGILAAAPSAEVQGVHVVAVDVSQGVPRDLALSLRLAAADVVQLHTGDVVPEDAIDAAVAAGAKVVVAEGSHRIGPVRREGRAIVAEGLGNLVFDCPCTTSTEGLVLDVVLTDPPQATVVPIVAGIGGRGASLPTSEQADVVFDRLESMGSTDLVRGDGEAAL